MGQQLVNFFEEAGKLGGIKAKMRLAIITQIPSSKAISLVDSNENIKKFKVALEELKREFQ